MQNSENFDKITQVKGTQVSHIGASPSGKATDSDSVIRVFESLRPSQEKTGYQRVFRFFLLTCDGAQEYPRCRVFARETSAHEATIGHEAHRRFDALAIHAKISSPQPRKNGIPKGIPFFLLTCDGAQEYPRYRVFARETSAHEATIGHEAHRRFDALAVQPKYLRPSH